MDKDALKAATLSRINQKYGKPLPPIPTSLPLPAIPTASALPSKAKSKMTKYFLIGFVVVIVGLLIGIGLYFLFAKSTTASSSSQSSSKNDVHISTNSRLEKFDDFTYDYAQNQRDQQSQVDPYYIGRY